MKKIKFSFVNQNDENDYIFTDLDKNTYHIYSDKRGSDIKGINKDFWDKFFFCESILVEYKGSNKRLVTRIISYK